MNVSEIKKIISSDKLCPQFEMLYGKENNAKERYLKACDSFTGLFGEGGTVHLFSAPGRTEISGNHTDHQHGCVLAGGVDLDVIAVARKTDGNIIRIKSEGHNEDKVDINDLKADEKNFGRSSSLIKGVCAAFKNNGYNIGGFEAYTTSNVLKGSGLSSSAAFEVLVSNILNGLYNGNKVDAVSIAKYSQFAEREFFGKPCGLLDQMASSVGGFTYADFNDPKNPVIEKIELDLSKSDHTLCVIDTGGNHADLTQDYADITIECKKISNALGVDFLRDANEEKFYSDMADLRKKYGDRAVLRGIHFFNENKRVLKQREALKNADFKSFFNLVNESGESSYKYLQNLYSTSNVSEQGLSLAIALTKQFLNGKGACRVHGGGFAGTIQCYIPNEMLSDYKEMIESVFSKGSFVALNIRPVGGYELKL